MHWNSKLQHAEQRNSFPNDTEITSNFNVFNNIIRFRFSFLIWEKLSKEAPNDTEHERKSALQIGEINEFLFLF